ANVSVCQPLADSFVNAPVASRVPVEVHRLPTCAPVLLLPLENETPVTAPATSDVNRTPTSIALASAELGVPGTGRLGTSGPGQAGGVTVPVTPADGVSRLPLSSTARLRRAVGPGAPGVHAYVQLVVPEALCQLAPPSAETSTPATAPPASEAVPLI